MENQFSAVTKEDLFEFPDMVCFVKGEPVIIMNIGGVEATEISKKFTDTEDQISDITIVAGGTSAALIWYNNGEVHSIDWNTESGVEFLVSLLSDFSTEQICQWILACISMGCVN